MYGVRLIINRLINCINNTLMFSSVGSLLFIKAIKLKGVG